MPDLPRLAVSIESAEKALRHFHNKGNEFRFVGTSNFLRYEKQYESWVQEAAKGLKQLFTTTQFADEFLNIPQQAVIEGENPQDRRERVFYDDLNTRLEILTRLTETLSLYVSTITAAATTRQEPIEIIHLICSRFHSVVRQLRNRREARATLDVQDEYDVQDLLHAVLRIYFDDIRQEEWTPSYAGGASRVDFLIKEQQLVIEVKKTRATLRAKELGEQLIVDIRCYKSHPDCKTLYCFVYDPDGYTANPKGLENDLSGVEEGLTVKVEIFPKH